MPKISIIIPVFNRADLVTETLDSVLAQTYTDWECIVVDDQSTDDSYEVIKRYAEKDSRIKAFRRSDDRIKGAPTCRNIGYENSSGEYIYFFDSDDLLAPEFFESVIALMNAHPESEYVVTPLDTFVESPKKTSIPPRNILSRYSGSTFEQLISFKVPVSTQRLVWRRTLLERSDVKWSEGLMKGQDSDFAFRILAKAPNDGVWLDGHPMVYFRHHSSQMLISVQSNDKTASVLTDVFINAFHCLYKNGKMDQKYKSLYLRGFTKNNLAITLLYGNRDAARKAYHFVSEQSSNIKGGIFLKSVAYLTYFFLPILLFCGTWALKHRYNVLIRWIKERMF